MKEGKMKKTERYKVEQGKRKEGKATR